MSVHRVGKPRIGLGDDGQAGVPAQLTQQRQQLVRSQRAVQADGVGSEALQRTRHRGDGTAGEGPPSLVKGHRDKDRQIGLLLHGQQGGLGLIEVGHRLDRDQIGPRRRAAARHFPKQRIGLLKTEASHGFQQLSQRPHVQGDPGRRSSNGLLGQGHPRRDDLLYAVTGVSQLTAVCPEGIGVDHLAARQGVFPADRSDPFRRAPVEQLRLAAGGQPLLLEHGAHSAVQQKDPVFPKFSFHSGFLPCAAYSSPAWNNRRTPGCGRAGACRTGRSPPSPIWPG